MAEEELGNKFNMKNVDFSVIRKALQASDKMVKQIIDGIHCGGTEIRHLILEESDIIIECKICRNLFRALPNFVAHKRIYCLDSFVSVSKVPSMYCPTPEDVVIVEPEPPDDAKDFVRNLTNNTSDCESESTAVDPKPVVKNSDCGKTFEKSCKRKPNLLLQKLTEIGPDEKRPCQIKTQKPPSESSKTGNSVASKDTGNFQQEIVLKSQLADYRELKCRKCNRKLSSRNSLSHHIVNLHAQRKRFYSCPYCGKIKGKFRYIGGVVRHLGSAHNLKKYQIDKLRKKVKENSWFEDNLTDPVQMNSATSKMNRNDLNGKKTSKENHNRLKLKIKIFSDSDKNKKPSYKMVQNHKPTIEYENQVDSTEEEKSVELTQSETQSSEEVMPELFCASDEKDPSQDSDLGNQDLENSNLSDEVASEISEKESFPEIEDEMEVSQVSMVPETTDSENRLSPTSSSTKLSLPHLPEEALELPTDSQLSLVLTTSSLEESSELDLEVPCKSETASPEIVIHQQKGPVEETNGRSSKEDHLEEKPDFTPLEALTPPKPDPDPSVGLEPAKAETSLENPLCSSDSNPVIKPRSSRSRMLFVCEHCKKCFGQKKTLDDHARLCSDWIHQPKPSSIFELQKPKVVMPKPEVKKEKDKRDFLIEPKKAIRRNIEKPTDAIQVDPLKTDGPNCSADKYDKEKVLAMIDGKALKCLDCNQKFSNQSHLRRHAVRHLGWRRFKCKLCKFTSYDKSETKTHIKRCHLGKTHGLTTKSVDYYIADLKADSSKAPSKKHFSSSKSSDNSATKSSKIHSTKNNDHSLGNLNGTKSKPLVSDGLVSQCNKDEKRICLKIIPPQFKNIRTSPRKPVPKIDRMSSLFIKKY